jgi:HlyD family secretion protein
MKKLTLVITTAVVLGAGYIVASDRYPDETAAAVETAKRWAALLPFSVAASNADEAQWKTAKVERGAIQSAVLATGTLQPVQTVQVSSQVSGQLVAILADYNAEVKAGDIIARLDATTFQGRLASAEADLAVAIASVDTKVAALERARHELDRIQDASKDADKSLERARQLAQTGAGTTRSVEQAELLARQTRNQVGSAQSDIAMAEADLSVANSSVEQKRAAVRIAKIDVDRTNIRAPIDGVVIDRQVELGQTVAASLSAPILFILAAELQEMQLEASIDEADVGRVKEGQPVRFTVDAYPGRNFDGKVTQVRRAAKTVSNVVTYTAVVTADNSSLALFPGMTANVRLIVERRQDILKVPTAAIRFRPTEQTDPQAPPGSAPRRARALRQNGDEGSAGRIYLVRAGGQLEPVEVKLGIAAENQIEITSDAVKEGDQVAIGRVEDPNARRRNNPLGF